MSTSCPGFLDQYGIWNNGFDCSLPRVCCGPDNNRYCCIPSSTSRSHLSSTTQYHSLSSLSSDRTRTTNNLPTADRWFFIQSCTIGISLVVVLLILIFVYLCLLSFRQRKYQKKISIIEVPRSPLLIETNRLKPNRISTISSASSDVKSRCTDISTVFNTPLNLYPTANSRVSTTSSSYYMYPNEFEYLCK